jgi:hypothetical protein
VIVKLPVPVGKPVPAGTEPAGVPIAQDVELVVFVKLQVNLVEPPLATVVGLAVNPLIVGGVTTVTVTDWLVDTLSELTQVSV